MSETNAAAWIIVLALALIALVLAVVAVVGFSRLARYRSATLRERFGPEYNRAVREYGRRAGERDLSARVQRVDKITLRELSDADRERFTSEWDTIQGQFIDDPCAAVGRANDLIKAIMRAFGYASDIGFEQRAADLSVEHPEVVEHYRAARALAASMPEEGTNTEELRQAIMHYRVLFADLLQPAPPTPSEPGMRPLPA